MIRRARRGGRIVRLKGGDPFVFGRGGEEAVALEAAGIPFEVLPGITSAVSAPALAGIPVTHRGLSSGFAVLTGHDAASLAGSLAAIAPGRLTLVILMAARRCREAAALLLATGWRPETPAAIVTAASRPDQAAWRGTIASLADAAFDRSAAGTIVVGEVAALDLRSTFAHAAPRIAEFDHVTEGATHVSRR
jgi:uroporphyrin-III C-methyltransferase/precorrin-2 dehydrogenase/sirohydrochlorin ferrochelatase